MEFDKDKIQNKSEWSAYKMKNLKFCLLAFGIIILSARLSVGEASSEPPEQRPAVLNVFDTIWKIILSPIMLFFYVLDYATQLGERSGAVLENFYYSHIAAKISTPAPETNEIPPLLNVTPQPQSDNILHRINAWVKSKTEVFKKPPVNERTASPTNTSDWQYPSDLSEESGQDTLSGLSWFLSPRTFSLNEHGKAENQTNATATDNMSASGAHRRKSRILSAVTRARDAMVEKVHKLGAKGRLAYDWVIWKLLARHSNLPTFFDKVNSTEGGLQSKFGSWLKHSNRSDPGPDYEFLPELGALSNSTNFVCDDIPSPVCAVDDNQGFTIFLNPCKLSVFNHEHHTNFTIYPTDVCMGLFIKYPDKFYKSKQE